MIIEQNPTEFRKKVAERDKQGKRDRRDSFTSYGMLAVSFLSLLIAPLKTREILVFLVPNEMGRKRRFSTVNGGKWVVFFASGISA